MKKPGGENPAGHGWKGSMDSGHKPHGLIESLLLEGGTRTKPGGIAAVIVAARAALVIDEFGDRIQKAPRRTGRRSHVRALATAGEQFLNGFDRTVVGRRDRCAGIGGGVGQHPTEEGFGCGIVDRAFTQGFHTGHEAIPRRDRDAELALDGLCVELGTVGYLDRAGTVAQRNGEGVVAHDANGRELRCRSEGPITCRG